MKIGVKEIFNEYNIDKKTRRFITISEIENYNNSREYILERLEDYKHYIHNFTNLNFRHLKDIDKYIPERSLIHIAQLPDISIGVLRRNLNILVEINKSLRKLKEELQQIDQNAVDEDVFRNIISSFNEKIANEIVYKGYSLKIGAALGIIRIKKILCDKRVKKRINWNESNKKRKEILLRGGLPFAVTKRDENRKAIEDNGGENWFVYFEGDFDYLWHWSKNRNIVFNSAYYKFRPTIYNNSSKDGGVGNVNKLSHLKTSNSPLLRNYY